MLSFHNGSSQWNNPNVSPVSSCPKSSYSFEKYNLRFSHRAFDGWVQCDFYINYNCVFMGIGGDYSTSNAKALLTSNKGDSSIISGAFYCKLENKFDTLTVAGVKYNTVYQMFYSPNWQNFKRIWWCPNVGFIKFEYINSSNQIETWDLRNYHIVL